VLVTAGVVLTFRTAHGADPSARFEQDIQKLQVPIELPRKDPSRRLTGVGRIQRQTNALSQRLNVLFAQASVRAQGAHDLALDASLDTAFQQTQIVEHTIGRG
jgi:hypothetical protein